VKWASPGLPSAVSVRRCPPATFPHTPEVQDLEMRVQGFKTVTLLRQATMKKS